MKILFSNKIFFDQKYGGISRYFYTLFGKFIEKNVTFKVIAPIYKNLYLKDINERYKKGIFIPRYPLNSNLEKLNNLISKKLINNSEYDILHDTHYSKYISNVKNKKKIVTIHDLIHEKFPEYYNSREIINTRKDIFEKIDHFICVSKTTKEEFLKIYNIPEKKISVIYHGSDHLDKISINKEKKKFRFLNEMVKPFILYVGNRYRYKNFQSLINAFNSSSLIKDNFNIIFFGGELMSKKEMKLYDEFNLNNKIIHVRGDDEVLKYLYSQARAMVSTSIEEGFGLNILEALKHQCKVFAKNIKVYKEIYEDKISYFDDEVSLRINLENFLQIENYKRTVSENTIFKKFTWEKTCSNMLLVYKNI